MAQIDEISKALEAQFNRWQELGKFIEATNAPRLIQQQQLQKDREEFLKVIARSPVGPATRQLLESKVMERLSKLSLEVRQKIFRDVPQRTRNALILLGAHGWYLGTVGTRGSVG